jgi:hypothetical protein
VEIGLLKIANDEDALIVSNYVVGQDAEVLIYVEYVSDATSNVVYPVCVDEVNGVRIGVRSNDKGKAAAITSDEEGDVSDIDDSDDSDYSESYVHFNDSEEERGLAVDDGLNLKLLRMLLKDMLKWLRMLLKGLLKLLRMLLKELPKIMR